MKMTTKKDSLIKRSAQFSIGVAIGSLIYSLINSHEQSVDFYRPVFVGIFSFIIILIVLTTVKRIKGVQ